MCDLDATTTTISTTTTTSTTTITNSFITKSTSKMTTTQPKQVAPQPLDCTKFPYGCCPEDPFPIPATGLGQAGCPSDCLCNPLGICLLFRAPQLVCWIGCG